MLALALMACTPPGPGRDPVRSEQQDEVVGSHQGPRSSTISDCVPAAKVVLNEVSPSNHGTLVDVEGDTVDWIELYNAGEASVDLQDWTLSDESDEPRKWTFPHVVLDPGAFLLVHASDKDRTRVVGSWETRIDEGHDWRYLNVEAEPDPDWFLPEYDDGSWAIGPSGFGRGDGDDQTVVDGNTVYVRTGFELDAADLADLAGLVLHVDYDDGFAAYLNGVEVARVALGGGDPPAWDALTDYGHEAELHQEGRPAYFDLEDAMGLLREGTNTLALEVHDAKADSGDLTLIPFLTVGWASDRGLQPSSVLGVLPTVDLHTNFAIRSSGEAVRLFDPATCETDELDPGPLWADESYGRQPDGTGSLGYFLEPTPGGPNVTESRPGFAERPIFDPPAGYYPGGTEVAITAAPDARVHVAWLGREPTEEDPVYGQPLSTGADGAAAVLRARAWQDGLWPSRVATATYLLEDPGTLPVVSVVTDPANLWDEETGIYVIGSEGSPDYPWRNANFLQEGWERPVHVEEWEPDGTLGFGIDGSVAIQGGNSRRHGQKNLEIALGGWSDEDTIEHEVFPGLEVEQRRLVLRAGGGDWLGCFPEECMGGTMLRDTLMNAITVGADVDRMTSRPARTYLNGEYWGLYLMSEKADLAYVEGHHGEDDIDLLRNNATPRQGDAGSYHAMMEWLRSHDLADPASYAHVQTLIDVGELQAYLIFQIYFDNSDWPGNNIKYWRPRADGGRWRWMLYGTEFGLGAKGGADRDALARALAPDGDDWPNPPWSTELFRLLLQSPEFTESFVNRYAEYLDTLLLPERTQELHRALTDEIADEIPRQADRWGTWVDADGVDALQGGEWDTAVAHVDDWLADRPAYARQHVVDHFGLGGTWTLALDADPPGGGTFELTAVTVEPPFVGTYFDSVPVTITAVPAPGYTFAGWSDPSLPDAATVTFDRAQPLDLVATFE